ncbi:MAG: hypothetical protein WD200_00395 [Candidatus Andersenbacteria bacterium]
MALPRLFAPKRGPDISGGRGSVSSWGGVVNRASGILGKSPHMDNYRAKRHEITKDYRTKDNQLRQDQRRQTIEHIKDLDRLRKDVDRQFNVELYAKRNHPKAAIVQKQADEKFERIKLERTRQFDKQKRTEVKQLDYERKKQIQNISKELRAQYKATPPSIPVTPLTRQYTPSGKPIASSTGQYKTGA